MTAGLDWDEWSVNYDDTENIHYQLNISPDKIGFILAVPMETIPGTLFRYNSGLSILLGEILRRAVSLPAHVFARQHLFQPLGIKV